MFLFDNSKYIRTLDLTVALIHCNQSNGKEQQVISKSKLDLQILKITPFCNISLSAVSLSCFDLGIVIFNAMHKSFPKYIIRVLATFAQLAEVNFVFIILP